MAPGNAGILASYGFETLLSISVIPELSSYHWQKYVRHNPVQLYVYRYVHITKKFSAFPTVRLSDLYLLNLQFCFIAFPLLYMHI